MRKLLGLFVALLTTTALVSLWVPREELQDKPPAQTIFTPKKYTKPDGKWLPLRWRPTRGTTACGQVFESRPENPREWDCYDASSSPNAQAMQIYRSELQLVSKEVTVSRWSAIGVVADDTLRVGVVALIVAICLGLIFAAYRLVAGGQEKAPED